MKTIVLGGGVIGIMTAYYLLKDGHEVTVIERQPGAGLETSFANGGIICPSLAEPWAAPGAFLEMLRSLGHEDAPLLLRLHAVPHMWRWGLQFIRNCSASRFRRNTERNLRLGVYSVAALREVRAETKIAYDETTRGSLKVFSDHKVFDHAVRAVEVLRRYGLEWRLLDQSGCVKAEPALRAGAGRIVGGLHFPGDESGDCHMFTQAIAAICAARGANFVYSTNIRNLQTADGAVTGVETDRGRFIGDAVIVALGSYTPMLLRPLGIRVPIYPVKGYTITVPAAPWPEAPTLPILDEARKFGMVRLGDRLRAAGSAEITGYDTVYSERRASAILKSAIELFPDFKRCLDPATARPWCGLRPFTPDGPPIVGRTPYRGLYLNAGHGHLGWTLFCGSGKALAEIVAGRDPGLDLKGLTLARYSQ